MNPLISTKTFHGVFHRSLVNVKEQPYTSHQLPRLTGHNKAQDLCVYALGLIVKVWTPLVHECHVPTSTGKERERCVCETISQFDHANEDNFAIYPMYIMQNQPHPLQHRYSVRRGVVTTFQLKTQLTADASNPDALKRQRESHTGIELHASQRANKLCPEWQRWLLFCFMHKFPFPSGPMWVCGWQRCMWHSAAACSENVQELHCAMLLWWQCVTVIGFDTGGAHRHFSLEKSCGGRQLKTNKLIREAKREWKSRMCLLSDKSCRFMSGWFF